MLFASTRETNTMKIMSVDRGLNVVLPYQFQCIFRTNIYTDHVYQLMTQLHFHQRIHRHDIKLRHSCCRGTEYRLFIYLSTVYSQRHYRLSYFFPSYLSCLYLLCW